MERLLTKPSQPSASTQVSARQFRDRRRGSRGSGIQSLGRRASGGLFHGVRFLCRKGWSQSLRAVARTEGAKDTKYWWLCDCWLASILPTKLSVCFLSRWADAGYVLSYGDCATDWVLVFPSWPRWSGWGLVNKAPFVIDRHSGLEIELAREPWRCRAA